MDDGIDDQDRFTDPLDPAGIGAGDWMCPQCAEDGDRDQLVRGRCPVCGSRVEHT